VLCDLLKQLPNLVRVSYAVGRPTRSTSHVNTPGVFRKTREQVFIGSVITDAKNKSVNVTAARGMKLEHRQLPIPRIAPLQLSSQLRVA
jgi:hypothetical protein